MASLLTHSLTDLIVVSLACEDANSKRVEFVTVADVDDEKRVDDSFVLFRLGQSLVKILKLKFGQYFAADAWLRL